MRSFDDEPERQTLPRVPGWLWGAWQTLEPNPRARLDLGAAPDTVERVVDIYIRTLNLLPDLHVERTEPRGSRRFRLRYTPKARADVAVCDDSFDLCSDGRVCWRGSAPMTAPELAAALADGLRTDVSIVQTREAFRALGANDSPVRFSGGVSLLVSGEEWDVAAHRVERQGRQITISGRVPSDRATRLPDAGRADIAGIAVRFRVVRRSETTVGLRIGPAKRAFRPARSFPNALAHAPGPDWLAELYLHLLPHDAPTPDALPDVVRCAPREDPLEVLDAFHAMLDALPYVAVVRFAQPRDSAGSTQVAVFALQAGRWDRAHLLDSPRIWSSGLSKRTQLAPTERCRILVRQSTVFESLREVSLALDRASAPFRDGAERTASLLVGPEARRAASAVLASGQEASFAGTIHTPGGRLEDDGDGDLAGLPVRYRVLHRSATFMDVAARLRQDPRAGFAGSAVRSLAEVRDGAA